MSRKTLSKCPRLLSDGGVIGRASGMRNSSVSTWVIRMVPDSPLPEISKALLVNLQRSALCGEFFTKRAIESTPGKINDEPEHKPADKPVPRLQRQEQHHRQIN